jgi:cob(I)alamin adenosyltransferase
MPEKFKPRMGSGDAGFTELFGGGKVKKTDLRVKTNALIDELNSLLGVVRAALRAGKDKREIAGIQRSLILASGLIAGARAGHSVGGLHSGQVKNSIAAIEALIAVRSKRLPPLTCFLLPGRNRTEALIHLARSRARLCELLAWQLKAKLPAVYLNRLSDYLFLLAAKK